MAYKSREAHRAYMRRYMQRYRREHGRESDPYLPVDRVIPTLDNWRLEHGGWEALGRLVSVSSRTLRRWRSGEQHSIRLVTLDQIVTALGMPHLIEDLYGDVLAVT